MKSKVNKLIIITGATSGIGLATAKILSLEGYELLLIGHTTEDLKHIQSYFNGKKSIFFKQVDLKNTREIKLLYEDKKIPWKDLYGLVNCAGTSIGDSILEITEEEWDISLQVNLTAPFLMTKHFLKKKVKQQVGENSGSIVNISSMLGLTGGKKPNYSAAKAGLIALTKSTAMITSEHGIRTNVICPGAVDTPMTSGWDKNKRQIIINNTPLKRIADAEEIGLIIKWLLSEESSFVTGAIINATGGQYLGN